MQGGGGGGGGRRTTRKKKTITMIILTTYRGFPTRMVYLYYISRVSDQNGVSPLYISCLRYTILVGNPRYHCYLFDDDDDDDDEKADVIILKYLWKTVQQ